MSWTRFQEIVLPGGALLLAPLSASNGLRLSPPETQSLSVSGTPTGGSLTLTFGGQTTAAIAWNATAAAVQAALQLLSSIGNVGCMVSGGPLPGATMTIQLIAPSLAGPQGLIFANGTNLTGGSNPTATVTRLGAGALEVPPASGAAGAQVAGMQIAPFALMTSAQLGNPSTLAQMATAYHAATGTGPLTGTPVDVYI